MYRDSTLAFCSQAVERYKKTEQDVDRVILISAFKLTTRVSNTRYTRKMLKSVVLLCLIVACVIAGPPLLLPGASENHLIPQCRTPKCPTTTANNDAPVTLPYPLDCLLYIICEESGPRTVACSGNLVYNKNTGQCDTRQNVNCVPCWQQVA